jgi:hypothetical protein
LTTGITTLPLPRWDDSTVVVDPPGDEPGAWSGAPSSIVADGEVYLAYRLRLPIGVGRGISNVVARSRNGLTFTMVAEVSKDMFGAESLERPALVRTPEGRWRLYVSAATPGTKHWRVDMLEADTAAGLAGSRPRTVLAGDATAGIKDPVLHHDEYGWHLWASVHPLESWDDADRMTTEYYTSPDGVRWTWRTTALAGRPGAWDARGVRISSVVVDGDGILAAYDGRASAGENWEERTGVARGSRLPDGSFGAFTAEDREPVGSPYAPNGLRYLSMVTMPDGRQRIYYESTRADGAHDLRTELV